jgi:hypothetical protein
MISASRHITMMSERVKEHPQSQLEVCNKLHVFMYIELESPTSSISPIQDLRCKVCISKNKRSKEAGKEESMKGQLLLQCWTVGDG